MWPLALLTRFLPLLTGPVTQFVTGINLNQVLSNVISALVAIAKFVKEHWRLCLIVGLAAGDVTGFYGWSHTSQVLKTERAAHKADVQSYKNAQAQANIAARAQEQQIIQESKVKANAADQNYSSLLTKYRTNLLRYQATQSSPQSTDGHQTSATESQTPSSIDGSGASPQFLTITLSDAQMCAVNTARLQAAHDWAINLGN